MIDKFEKNFLSLMRNEGLDNYSHYFSEFDSYEEIPLFSRYKNIEFLDSMSFNDKNKYLIKNGISIVKYIIELAPKILNKKEMDEFFICLSIMDWDLDDYNEINCLTPNIYVSRKKTWLLSCLKLTQKNTIEENLVKEYLCSLNVKNSGVYVANTSNIEFKRVYILNQCIL